MDRLQGQQETCKKTRANSPSGIINRVFFVWYCTFFIVGFASGILFRVVIFCMDFVLRECVEDSPKTVTIVPEAEIRQ